MFPKQWISHWKNICFLRVIPTLTHYSDIVSDIASENIYGINILTFFLAYPLPFYLASILTFFLALYLTSILTSSHLF